MRLSLTLLAILVLTGIAAIQIDQFGRSGGPVSASVDLTYESNLDGFQKIYDVRPIVFPEDTGAHPDYFLEWWYYTGNLEDETGNRYGFQLTFFRRGLSPGLPERASEWASNQLYFTHFTVTDEQGETFDFHERFSRGGPGLAGVTADPYRVWLEDWYVEEIEAAGRFDLNGLENMSGSVPNQTRMVAYAGTVGIDLVVNQNKPVTLQGDRGFSQKSASPGNASYYYSFTRNLAEGTVTTPRGTFNVTGKVWKDHEWSTSILDEGNIGWDWFALKLDDEREVMFFNIRNEDGSTEQNSHGTVIHVDGTTTHLSVDDAQAEAIEFWTSPESGVTYPVAWNFEIPSEEMAVEVRALFPHQELRVSTSYWEGAVDISGTHTGVGYVELTGYDQSIAARLNGDIN